MENENNPIEPVEQPPGAAAEEKKEEITNDSIKALIEKAFEDKLQSFSNLQNENSQLKEENQRNKALNLLRDANLDTRLIDLVGTEETIIKDNIKLLHEVIETTLKDAILDNYKKNSYEPGGSKINGSSNTSKSSFTKAFIGN